MSLDDELEKIRRKVSAVKEEIGSMHIENTPVEENSDEGFPFEVTSDGIKLGSLSLGLEEVFKDLGKTIEDTVKFAVDAANAGLKGIKENENMSRISREINKIIHEYNPDIDVIIDSADLQSIETTLKDALQIPNEELKNIAVRIQKQFSEQNNSIKDEILGTLGEEIMNLKQNMREGLETHKEELMEKMKELQRMRTSRDSQPEK